MDHSQDANGAVVAAMAAYGLFIGIVVLGSLVLGLIINWRIAAKAGFSGALSLLMLVPLVNLLILIVFAFSEWPIERELKLARAGGFGGNPGGGFGGPGGGGSPWGPQPTAPQQPQLGTWGPPTTSA